MEFEDVEDEYLKKYTTEKADKIKLADGSLFDPWDDRFKKDSTDILYPKGSKKIKVKYNELYPTFEEYMKDYCGFEKRNIVKKRYGYMCNPNSKWDWYSIGGRWSGSLKLKKGKNGSMGHKSWTNSGESDREGWVDQAYKEDIDFSGMKKDAGNRAKKEYELIEKAFGGKIPKIKRSWKEVREDEAVKKDINQARELYHNQPAIKKCNKIKKEIEANKKNYSEKDYQILSRMRLEDYQCTKETYIEHAKNSAVSFYAVLINGEWYERGTMGWWGISTNEVDEKEWFKQQADLLDSVDDDTLITVVDCHI